MSDELVAERDALREQFGPFVTPMILGDVVELRHPSRESAEAFRDFVLRTDPEADTWVEERNGDWFRMERIPVPQMEDQRV